MALFGKRKHAASAPTTDVPSGVESGGLALLLAGYQEFRALVVRAPDLGATDYRGTLFPAEAASGGPHDGKVDGWTISMFETGVASTPFVTSMAGPSKRPEAVLSCVRGDDGDHVEVFAPDGSSSFHGPWPSFASLDEWTTRSCDMCLAVLSRRFMDGADGDDRVRAPGSSAFEEFARRGNAPLVESWRVIERHATYNGVLAEIEIWGATVDRSTNPPNPYHTPLVAAGLAPDGRIDVMAALELMPASHDDVYIVLFQDGARTNMGVFPDGVDLDAFRSAVLTMFARPDY